MTYQPNTVTGFASATLGEATCATPREKHLNLFYAITSIEGVEYRLMELSNRISGADSEKSIEPPIPDISLQEVLNETPDRIKRLCEEMHSIIDSISVKLF